MTEIERFWSKVDRSGDCWLWLGGKYPSGYGLFNCRVDGRKTTMQASRYAYIATFGPLDRDRLVLHRCDNRPCVRPDHLFAGSAKDNMDDMRAKGRARWGAYNTEKTHCVPEEKTA